MQREKVGETLPCDEGCKSEGRQREGKETEIDRERERGKKKKKKKEANPSKASDPLVEKQVSAPLPSTDLPGLALVGGHVGDADVVTASRKTSDELVVDVKPFVGFGREGRGGAFGEDGGGVVARGDGRPVVVDNWEEGSQESEKIPEKDRNDRNKERLRTHLQTACTVPARSTSSSARSSPEARQGPPRMPQPCPSSSPRRQSPNPSSTRTASGGAPGHPAMTRASTAYSHRPFDFGRVRRRGSFLG